MSKLTDSKALDGHLEDALKQQDFLKQHLHALKHYLADREGGLSGQALAKSYDHLQALTLNQQAILNDILAVQKSLLTDSNIQEARIEQLDTINEMSIGALRRAHEPMLQLVRDNQNLLQKLLQVWKNLCHFLGLQLKQGMQKNLENLEFQLGLNAIQFELQTFNHCLKQLEHQQNIIDKKLKAINRVLKHDHHLEPEALVLIKAFVDEAKAVFIKTHEPELDMPPPEAELKAPGPKMKPPQPEVDMPTDLPQPILDGVNLSLRKGSNNMPQMHYQYDWSIPEPTLTDDRRQNLEHALGVDQTNLILRQIQALHIQGNRLMNQERELKQHLLELENEVKFHKFLKPQLEQVVSASRLERDQALRRTLFYRPEPK